MTSAPDTYEEFKAWLAKQSLTAEQQQQARIVVLDLENLHRQGNQKSTAYRVKALEEVRKLARMLDAERDDQIGG